MFILRLLYGFKMQNQNAKIKPRNHLINCGEVARRLNLSQGYIYSLLRGDKDNPRRMKQILNMVLQEFRFARQRCKEAKLRIANDARKRGASKSK